MNKPSIKLLSSILFFYFLYLLYMAGNILLLKDGQHDFVFMHFGIPRTEQIIWVSLFVLGSTSFIGFVAFRNTLPRPQLSKKKLQALIGVLLLLQANAVTSSLDAVIADMHKDFLLPIYSWVIASLVIQLLAAFLFVRYIRSWFFQIAVLAILASFAFYSLNLSLAPWYVSGSMPKQLFFALLVFILSFTIFSLVAYNLVKLRTISIILAISAIYPVLSLMIESVTGVERNDLSQFQKIVFKDKPNIHIISVESLAAPVVIKKNLDVPDVPYEKTIKQNNIPHFKNAFSGSVPTTLSLNSVMRLAQSSVSPNMYDYFTGGTPSALGSILRQNGYHLSTGFPVPFFFSGKGDYVDQYVPDTSKSVRNNSLCLLAGAPVVSFFGFCELTKLIDDAPIGQAPDWVEQIISIIKSSDKNSPAFTFHHILEPFGHTPGGFRTGNPDDIAKYRKQFIYQSKIAAGLIQKLHDTFQHSGLENSIIILMGDHGVLLSDTIAFEDAPEFYVQDRHGIILAVLYNSTHCHMSSLKYYIDKFATPSRLLGGLIRCLAENPEQVDEAFDFVDLHDFANFLYE